MVTHLKPRQGIEVKQTFQLDPKPVFNILVSNLMAFFRRQRLA